MFRLVPQKVSGFLTASLTLPTGSNGFLNFNTPASHRRHASLIDPSPFSAAQQLLSIPRQGLGESRVLTSFKPHSSKHRTWPEHGMLFNIDDNLNLTFAIATKDCHEPMFILILLRAVPVGNKKYKSRVKV